MFSEFLFDSDGRDPVLLRRGLLPTEADFLSRKNLPAFVTVTKKLSRTRPIDYILFND